jgi:hypothetical protein
MPVRCLARDRRRTVTLGAWTPLKLKTCATVSCHCNGLLRILKYNCVFEKPEYTVAMMPHTCMRQQLPSETVLLLHTTAYRS